MKTFFTLLVLAALGYSAYDYYESNKDRWSKWEQLEFKQAVYGKTESEIRELIGEPEGKMKAGDRPMWIYNEITYSTHKGVNHATTTLVFNHSGQVIDVKYRDGSPLNPPED